MEHVSGQDLTATLQDCRVLGTPLPIEDILHLAMDVATGLKHIAGAGIVHRDIKPSNILISDDGQAKIIDFGIATTMQEEQFTDDNHVLGTFGYMSPEQWSGQVVDQRSDIYSFGIVLFELAAGMLSPQRSDLGYAVHPEFACDRMLLRRLRPDIPKGLDDIIEQCLRRDRRLRYHGFESLVRDLGLVIDGLHAPRRPLTALWMVRPRWHHFPEAVIVLLLLCVVAIYVLL
jgi:eukaryotic-like serine/threonine-protein kinase